MMTACHLLRFKELGIENLALGCTSFAIYGSFNSGNFDERSDLDLLVIGEEEDVHYSPDKCGSGYSRWSCKKSV